MSAIETVVYYSVQHAPGSYSQHVLSSPIHSANEKAFAEAEARQTVKVTMGDLQIVVFVCDDLTTDDEIYQQTNFLKRAAIGLVPDFTMSNYLEDASGQQISEDEDLV
jgi:hypothetical protein